MQAIAAEQVIAGRFEFIEEQILQVYIEIKKRIILQWSDLAYISVTVRCNLRNFLPAEEQTQNIYDDHYWLIPSEAQDNGPIMSQLNHLQVIRDWLDSFLIGCTC